MIQIFDAYALAGGILIGLSALLYLLLNGQIAGISGMCSRLLPGGSGAERLTDGLFLLAMIVAGGISYVLTAPDTAELRTGFSPLLLVIAGFLVGFGTRLASGCTSGHGVCGLGRRSWRSLAATLCFMASGVVTVWLLRLSGVLS